VNAASARAALAAAAGAPGAPPNLTSVPMSAKAPPDPARVAMPAGRWSRYAGKLGAALTVTFSAASIRKGGREPNEPDDADVDLLQEALDEGLRLKFGDTGVPWWLGCALAAGGVYAGMRIGAKKLPTADEKPTTPPALVPDHQPEKKAESPLRPAMFPPAVRMP